MLTLANHLLLAAENADATATDHSLLVPFIVGGGIMLGFLLLLLTTSSYSNNHTMATEDVDLIDPNRQVGPLGAGR